MNTTTIHYAPKYFSNPNHPITITVVGCGGTGSRLLPKLGNLDQALQEFGHPGLMVNVYDNDFIEEHNVLKRQNFLRSDIGKKKASTLVTKYNMIFGTQWKAFDSFCDSLPETNIVITCVDKVDFRNRMNLYVNSVTKSNKEDYKTNFYWLDCGNGKDFGQVVLTTLQEIEQPNSKNFEVKSKLKSVYDIFGDLNQFTTKETQGIESCSFIQSNLEQDLFINEIVSVHAAELLKGLVLDLKLHYQGVVINQKSFNNKGIPV